jgi:tetratricopeptide (TPR) repeat protein
MKRMLLLSCCLLGACAGTPPPATAPSVVRRDGAELLLEVRRAAVDADDALEIQPLEDPMVADLRQQAESLEAAGDFAAAERAYRRALDLNPDAPQLLQLHAEMNLALGALDEAEQIAARAYEQGPKSGPLCRRSWATVRLAREQRGNREAALTAAQQAQRCATPPPVRM